MQHGDNAISSRQLSAAIFRGAASRIGVDPERPWMLRGDEDGAFRNFLESLENGSLHTSLTQNGCPNFLRMFRRGIVDNSKNAPARQTTRRSNSSTQAQDVGTNSDGRLVSIIIVGINPADAGFPPIIDAALAAAPPNDASDGPLTAATTPNDASDTLILTAHYSPRVIYRRRASIGNHQAQPPYGARPISATSESLTGERPQPSPPSSADFSTYLSSTITPAQTIYNAGTTSVVSSYHSSFVGNTASRLESTSEESKALQALREHRSDSDIARHSSGSSRRNSISGPDPADDIQEEHCWIIYVLVGSYRETNLFLRTPSFFSGFLTLFGPAKPPVATEADVARAPGLFRVSKTINRNGEQSMIGTDLQGDRVLTIAVTGRCPICLCEFEEDELVRQLGKCHHLFHRVGIDQWLTSGRNSCPSCRREGVEKSSDSLTPTEEDPMGLSA